MTRWYRNELSVQTEVFTEESGQGQTMPSVPDRNKSDGRSPRISGQTLQNGWFWLICQRKMNSETLFSKQDAPSPSFTLSPSPVLPPLSPAPGPVCRAESAVVWYGSRWPVRTHAQRAPCLPQTAVPLSSSRPATLLTCT